MNSSPGFLAITGFDAAGKGSGTSLEVLRIYWTTSDVIGDSRIDLVVNNLNDVNADVIGTPAAVGCSVYLSDSRDSSLLPGDVNGDGVIDILDALMTAQYYVGLSPAGFSASSSDVNNNGVVNIIDALMIARYCVGLISRFPV